MGNLFPILGTIAIFFFIFLIIKSVSKKNEKFCAICAAVSLTWGALLGLYWSGIVQDFIIIALLIGQSTLGIYYLIESKVKAQLTIFRLPFLLTLTVIAYRLITPITDIKNVAIFLILLWAFCTCVYFYRTNKQVARLFKKMVECCKRW